MSDDLEADIIREEDVSILTLDDDTVIEAGEEEEAFQLRIVNCPNHLHQPLQEGLSCIVGDDGVK